MDLLAGFWSNDHSSSLPSFRSIFSVGSQALLSNQIPFNSGALSCPSPQLSCHNTSAVTNLCCFNYPGGQMLSTQFWDTHPPTGPSDSWTLHGLWPDRCDGTYEAYCDDTRTYNNITQILESHNAHELLSTMSTYWKDYQGHDSTLWSHEWSKHGTCVSTLSPTCYSTDTTANTYKPQIEVVDYFAAAVHLYQTLPTYTWLSEADIVPDPHRTYTRAQIQDVLTSRHGRPVTIGCRGGALDEIWYHFDVRGSVQTGEFVPTDPDGSKGSCPATGIRYLPKSSSGTKPTATYTTGVPPAPTATEPPFTGKGQLNVRTGGEVRGCIISGGTWYFSGTCAGFTATSVDDGEEDGGFVLASRKGKCAIVKGVLKCAASIHEGTVFASQKNSLTFGGNGTFFADGVPRGFKQGSVYVEEEGHGTDLSIEWQSV